MSHTSPWNNATEIPAVTIGLDLGDRTSRIYEVSAAGVAPGSGASDAASGSALVVAAVPSGTAAGGRSRRRCQRFRVLTAFGRWRASAR